MRKPNAKRRVARIARDTRAGARKAAQRKKAQARRRVKEEEKAIASGVDKLTRTLLTMPVDITQAIDSQMMQLKRQISKVTGLGVAQAQEAVAGAISAARGLSKPRANLAAMEMIRAARG